MREIWQTIIWYRLPCLDVCYIRYVSREYATYKEAHENWKDVLKALKAQGADYVREAINSTWVPEDCVFIEGHSERINRIVK